MSTPLRPFNRGEGGAGPESPEALMISAMIEDGTFDAARFRVSDDDLACLQQLWAWCEDHQDRVGRAPGIELLSRHFPEFHLTPDVDPYWAAHRLRQASAARRMRSTVQEALTMLSDEDVDGAYALMSELQAPVGMRRPAVELFDVEDDNEFTGTRIDVPFARLGAVTGGIGAGEMWAIGARTGAGKTNIAAGAYVPVAIKEGFSVAYFSCEMPAGEIAQLARRGLAGKDRELSKLLSSTAREHREHAAEILRSRTPQAGALHVYDPSHCRMTVDTVRDAMMSHDLVVIDHIELMSTSNGHRAIEDWRVLAEISIRLNEEVLRHKGRLIVLSQVNRAGESTSPLRAPKLSELSGSDQLGRDCSVGITMNRFSDSVMLHDAVKVRRGPGVRFFSQYSPAVPSFMEITRQVAQEIANRDEDAKTSGLAN